MLVVPVKDTAIQSIRRVAAIHEKGKGDRGHQRFQDIFHRCKQAPLQGVCLNYGYLGVFEVIFIMTSLHGSKNRNDY
jgi:hypothetical protein